MAEKQWIEELTEEQRSRIRTEFGEDPTHMIIHRDQGGKLIAEMIEHGYVGTTAMASLTVTPRTENSGKDIPIFVEPGRTNENANESGEPYDE